MDETIMWTIRATAICVMVTAYLQWKAIMGM